jgi:gas vesicle protein
MPDFRTQDQSAAQTQTLKDKLDGASEDVRQRTGDALKASGEIAREKFSELSDAARDVASHTAGRVQEEVNAQQDASADYVGRFAQDIRNSAKAFERDAPFAARGIETAAEYVADAAEKIRSGSFRDLANGATSFARAQPAAFLGLSVLAGFAAVRFLKAGSNADTSTSD